MVYHNSAAMTAAAKTTKTAPARASNGVSLFSQSFVRAAPLMKHRASIAAAKSSARLNALMKSGSITGTSDFARRIMPPEPKSAPRAVCAFIILSAS